MFFMAQTLSVFDFLISGSFFSLKEFSFSQVWYSNQQPVHCAFTLQRHNDATTQLSCKISVRQVKGHEQILQVYTSLAEVRSAML